LYGSLPNCMIEVFSRLPTTLSRVPEMYSYIYNKIKRVNILIVFLLILQRWTGIKRPLRHSIQKNRKGPQNFSKRLFFWHFVWEIEKATATKVSLPLWLVRPCFHYSLFILYSTKNIILVPNYILIITINSRQQEDYGLFES
jgi:hypothetical protein